MKKFAVEIKNSELDIQYRGIASMKEAAEMACAWQKRYGTSALIRQTTRKNGVRHHCHFETDGHFVYSIEAGGKPVLRLA